MLCETETVTPTEVPPEPEKPERQDATAKAASDLEEAAEFIAREVLEKDATMFEG